MWIAICAPVMLLACLVAIIPLVHGTFHENWEQPVATANVAAIEIDSGAGPQIQLVCPPCGEVVRASGHEALFDALREHAWTRHGVPHPALTFAVERVPD
jgi:hypothetical protein